MEKNIGVRSSTKRIFGVLIIVSLLGTCIKNMGPTIGTLLRIVGIINLTESTGVRRHEGFRQDV